MRRYKRLQRLHEAAERGDTEVPKPRSRSSGSSKKRKREGGDEGGVVATLKVVAGVGGEEVGAALELRSVKREEPPSSAASTPRANTCKRETPRSRKRDGKKGKDEKATTDEERSQLAALIASTNESASCPPLSELDIDVINKSISPSESFLAQMSPTLSQPLTDEAAPCAAKSSPFDFSSALQVHSNYYEH